MDDDVLVEGGFVGEVLVAVFWFKLMALIKVNIIQITYIKVYLPHTKFFTLS